MAKENIDDLDRKLASCLRTIDAKNMEILNLQTAVGQYDAEIEAKSISNGDCDHTSKREKEDILGRLSEAEGTIADGKSKVTKDNEKLRWALEQSMTWLNRMSVDSFYLVESRHVIKRAVLHVRTLIKLSVTYFQRNHSKGCEQRLLMVHMLGFSDEDMQRLSQEARQP
ncbi:golgin candidate 4 [Striga asiatica]|uniref:Golgin candidate 4 n=1 Tax=Striga asiatica TaxID=4170 RepID=A0A5A7QMV8_STRAF|nr:golgin candidate 4 [Striga asiatica]